MDSIKKTIRPAIVTEKVAETGSEQFQNEVLRPILKLNLSKVDRNVQSSLLISKRIEKPVSPRLLINIILFLKYIPNLFWLLPLRTTHGRKIIGKTGVDFVKVESHVVAIQSKIIF